MSWCDKLASTPAATFRLDHHVVPSAIALQCLSPILDKLVSDDAPQFNVEKNEPFALVVNTEPGFRYSIDQNTLSVQFNHRVRFKHVSGGPPTMELLSEPRPFTSLLPDVIDRLIEFTALTPNIERRQITRFGVTSNTQVDFVDLPPGILKLVDYASRPWPGDITNYLISLTTQISDTKDWSDRCTFILARAEDKTKLMSAQFEWQRLFKSTMPTTSLSMKNITAEAIPKALKYLEEIAVGNVFDEAMTNANKHSKSD